MGIDCKYCGAYISSGLETCPACGKRNRLSRSERERSTLGYDPEFDKYKPNFDDYNYKGGYAGAGAAEETAGTAYKREAAQDTRRQESAADQHRRKSWNGVFGRNIYENESDQAEAKDYNRRREQYRRSEERAKSEARSTSDGEEYNRSEVMRYLCYMGPLFFIPLLMDGRNEFIRFHANQGLVLFICSLLVSFVFSMWIFELFFIYCFVKGLLNVNRGLMEPLPVIGKIQLLR